MKACMKSEKNTMKKCFDANKDVTLALLQVRSTSIGNAFPSIATILFNRLINVLMPKIKRMPKNISLCDGESYEALTYRQ